jgi:hypothetical protein
MFKVYQIIRFKRTYGYITVLEDDHALVKDLNGKMHSIKLVNLVQIPGLEHPIAPKDLHKDDFVAVATAKLDKGYGIKLTVEYLKVSKKWKVSNRTERNIGRYSFPLTDIPTWRSQWNDGEKVIRGIFKLDWRY